MYLLDSYFDIDLLNAIQPFFRFIVVIICMASAMVLLSYKRGKSKFRLWPSVLAYVLTLAMISDPILILTGYPKEVDLTEILGRSYILAILLAHRGNAIGAFKGANWPRVFTHWKKSNEYKREREKFNQKL